MVYFIGFILTIGSAEILSNNRSKINRTNLIVLESICMLPMFLISALRRYDVGNDLLYVYINGFKRVCSGIYWDNFEIGFKTLLQLLGKITQSPQIMVIATSFIFVFFTWRAIYDESVDIVLSIVILFASRYFFISLNVIRQWMGMAIILYAIQFIVKKQYVKYIIFNLLAASFHTSLILCLIFLIFDKIRLNSKKRLIISLGILVLGGLLQRSGVISKIIINIADGFEKYSMYTGPNAAGGAYYTGTNFRLFQIMLNLFILFIMIGVFDSLKDNSYYNLFLYLQIISVFICFIMSSVPLLERVYWIFGFAQIISIPLSLSAYTDKYIKLILTFLLIIIMGSFCIYDIFYLHDHNVVPYYSIFSKSVLIN